MIGQDHLRRDLLWEHATDQGDTIALVESIVSHCLQRGRTVIVEGIFKADRYREMCARILARHGGSSLVYYLDVSLAETLRRHSLKPIAHEVDTDEVASWYAARDVLGMPQEVILPEHTSEDDTVARILADLAALGESRSGEDAG